MSPLGPRRVIEDRDAFIIKVLEKIKPNENYRLTLNETEQAN